MAGILASVENTALGYIAGGVFLLALVGGAYIHHVGYESGHADAIADQQSADTSALSSALANVEKAKAAYDPIQNAIVTAKDQVPVCAVPPVIQRTLDMLP